jgi:hypothetical protein
MAAFRSRRLFLGDGAADKWASERNNPVAEAETRHHTRRSFRV